MELLAVPTAFSANEQVEEMEGSPTSPDGFLEVRGAGGLPKLLRAKRPPKPADFPTLPPPAPIVKPPVAGPGLSRNPSGLFGDPSISATCSFAEKPVGTAKNSTQSESAAASWSAPRGGRNNPPVAPQPQGFMFESGPLPAGDPSISSTSSFAE